MIEAMKTFMTVIMFVAWIVTLGGSAVSGAFWIRFILWSAKKRKEQETPFSLFMMSLFGVVGLVGVFWLGATFLFRWAIG